MFSNLISIKDFLGQNYQELLYSASQDKYKNTNLDELFEQRFYVQNNKTQVIVDTNLYGLEVLAFGNEIRISERLYNHPSVVIFNSTDQANIFKSKNLYRPEIFSTIAYMLCDNCATIQIVGNIEEPVYVRYKSDYETFYNSVFVFDVFSDIEVEIIEEVESLGALNFVINYVAGVNSEINLTTFYQNRNTALSFCYRNVISQDFSQFNHTMYGKGSSNIVDESKIHTFHKSKSSCLGIINSNNRYFHSILYIEPIDEDYDLDITYKNIITEKGRVSFLPLMRGHPVVDKVKLISISDLNIDQLNDEDKKLEIRTFISDVLASSQVNKIVGVRRFYDNKRKFLDFP